jgi:hypothetical protein
LQLLNAHLTLRTFLTKVLYMKLKKCYVFRDVF